MEFLSLFIIVSLICNGSLGFSEGIKQLSQKSEKLRKLESILEARSQKNKGGLKTQNAGSNDNTNSCGSTRKMVSLQRKDDDYYQNNAGTMREKRSTDDFNVTDASWSAQWHLHPDQIPSLGVYEAWKKGYTGKGIAVGLVDVGIDTTHYDLVDNYEASLSYDFVDDIAGGSYVLSDEKHGTLAAGVIAASKNDHCIIGVAYEATIASYRVQTDIEGFTDTRVAMAFGYNYDAVDIYNNAYGIIGYGIGFYESSEILRSAIMEGITQGRNGKGSIYVFAAGGDGEYDDDCNTSENVNSIYTISVNSLAPEGGPATYAEECTCIMAATYGGQNYNNGTKIYLPTTNLNNTCIENHGGASPATSTASGILALTLQANPDLTWRDVQHLIAETSTSDGVPGVNFSTNGAGKNVSLSLGFGVMNANRLVDAAATWKTVPGGVICSTGTLEVDECCTSSVEASYVIEDCHIQYLEHVQIHVKAQATWREYTQIHVVSPLGTDSRILRERPQDYEIEILEWTFMSVHHWGENPLGNWSIRMDDSLNCDNEMHLYNWGLTLYGTVTDPKGGIPSNGTLGGYCDNVTMCMGTDCLLGSNICVDCSIPGFRVVDSFCVKDGYGYCDASITCKEEHAECSADNVCITCASGFRFLNGTCKQDRFLGGYCDAVKVCEDVGVACDSDTNLCINCTDGYRIVGDFCKQDGVNYCDQETPCILGVWASCEQSTNTCVNCQYVANSRVLDGFCIEDGTIGGYCSSNTACVADGSGCSADTGTCVDCTVTGYRNIDGYCMQDGTVGGYCDTDVTCYNGTGCDIETELCVNCSFSGYRVLPNGYCRQDGVVDGYCDLEVPCITFAAGCLPGYNICAICYAGHTIVDGYCIEDDVPGPLAPDESDSSAGKIAGIVIAGFATGILLNGMAFIVILQKVLVAKTGYAPQNLKDRFQYVFKLRDGIAK